MTTRAALLAIATVVVAGACGPTLASDPPAAVGTGRMDPAAAVGIYLEAVDRGELRVFERRLDRSTIVPTRVEYVFELGSPTPMVKVYAKLKRPMAVPDRKDCEVRGVSAILDAAGRILETEAHVWPKQQTTTDLTRGHGAGATPLTPGCLPGRSSSAS